ncbi:MAG: HAD-IIIA family hydrolase [Saprospiraceae bacterium]|nr:HAD-IIIA family hydrolase [Saprospiraceae bacterium]MCB9322198.1 HAD-IIIA family hydrolase [Lewinellaceae bacterium]
MNLLEAFKDIDTFIFDVDGVLTDSNFLITETGELLRTMNVRDGYAMKRALDEGYRICIITGGNSKGVTIRLKALGIEEVHSGIKNKISTYNQIVERLELEEGGILYMGDDLPDYEVMRRVGLPACPVDAVEEIREIANYISPFKGGMGCVRDVIEKVLRLQGKW